MCNNSAVVYHLENKVAFVARGNCTFLEKAVVVQNYGAVAVVVVSSTESVSVNMFVNNLLYCYILI